MDPKLRRLLEERRGDLFFIDEDATLKELVVFLTTRHVGAVMVRNQAEKIVGLVSERDIIRKLASTDGEIQGLHVKYIMTPRQNFITGAVNDHIDYLLAMMQRNNIRHIPIVDEQEQVLALFSSRDFIRVILEHTTEENQQLRDFIYGHYAI